LRKIQTVDKIGDLSQGAFNDLPAAAGDTEAKNSALPEILVTALGYGDIELMGDSRLDSPEHPAFSF